MRLQDLKKKEALHKSAVTEKTVRIFLRSLFFTITGTWTWDLETEAVLCTDVILSLPASFDGTRAIFHPDDATTVYKQLSENAVLSSLQFRIITTYGDVKLLTGENLCVERDEEGVEVPQQEALAAAQREVIEKSGQRHFETLRHVAEKSERYTATGTWYHNAATGRTWYSDFVFALHGLPPQSLNAHLHTFLPFVHPDDTAVVQEFVDRAFQEKTPLHLEYRVLVGQNTKWVSYKSHWCFGAAGELIMGGTLQDATEQKEAEKTQDAYRAVAQFQRQQLVYDEQQLNVGHWQINLLTRKATYSDQYYRIYGLKPQSTPATVTAFLNFLHPDDRDRVEATLRKIIYEHETPDLEYRIVRPTGQVRYVQQKAKVVTYEGELMVAGLLQDVTVARMLEARLAEAREESWLNGVVQQQAAETAALFTWVFDLEAGKFSWSESFFRFTGHQKQAPQNITEKTLFGLVHPHDAKDFRQRWAEALHRREPASFSFRFMHGGVVSFLKADFRFYTRAEKTYFVGTVRDSTAEQLLQEQLSERAQLVDSLSKNIIDRVLVTDVNHAVLFWNEACEKAYGVRRADAVGENFFDLFPHLKTEKQTQFLQRVLRGEKVVEEGCFSGTGNGYYNLYLLPIYQQGEVSSILHVVHDVTSEVELRKKLNDRLQFIESIVQSSVDRIVALDRNLNYLYWNRQAEAYYGLRKEEVLGKNILEVFPQLVNDPSYSEIRRALRGETVHLPPNVELNILFETYLVPIKGNKNDVIGLLWIAHDRTAEMRLQGEQRKAQLALQEEHRRLKEAQAIGHVGSFEWNAATDTLVWSDEVYHIHGLVPQSEVMTLDRVLSLVHPEDKANFEKQVMHCRREVCSVSFTHRIRRADGEVRIISRKLQSFGDEAGNVTHLSGTMQDVTEQVTSDEQIRTSEALLRSAEEVAKTGSYEADLRTGTFRFSEGMYRLFGEEPNSFVLTLDWIDSRSLADDVKAVKTVLDNAVATGQPYTYKRRIYRKNGELRVLEAHGKVVTDVEGRSMKLLGLVQDVTEREKAAQELRDSKAFIEEITRTTPDLITIHNTDNRVLYSNNDDFWKVIYKIEGEQNVTNEELMEAIVHPDDLQKATAFVQERKRLRDDEIKEADLKVKNGRWIRIRSKVFKRDAQGLAAQIISFTTDITEQKIAEARVQEQAHFLQRIQATVPDMLSIMELSTREFTYLTKETFRANGFDPDAMLKMSREERMALLHPDDLPVLAGYYAAFDTVSDDAVASVEYRARKQDGSWQWFYVQGKVFERDASGRVTHILNAISNITERKKVEEELQKNFTLLQHTEEIAQTGSWEYNIATGEFNWSEGMYRLFGLPQGIHVRPETYLDFGVEEDRSVAKRLIKNLKKAHESFEETMRIRRGDKVRLLKIKGSVVNGDSGQPQKIVGVDLDITDTREAEEKIAESRRLLEQMAVASPDAITIYDLQKKQPVYLNNCIAVWTGLTLDELVNMGVEGRLRLIHPDDRLRLLHFNEKVALADDGNVLKLEYRLKTASDDYRWIRNRTKVFGRDANGKVTRILSILVDVSDEKATEHAMKNLNATLEKKNLELAQRNEEITNFAFIASHDLKEPIRKIHTFSHWLVEKEADGLSTRGREFAMKIASSVKRLDSLMEGITTLTKLEAVKGQPVEVDLNGVLSDAREELKETTQATNAVVQSTPLPVVHGDRTQLVQLFRHLLSNAIKFQKPGAVPVVEIAVTEADNPNDLPEGRYSCLHFADNGIGFESNYNEKIFQVFQRLHGQEQYSGTGIGLAIVKKIMENHGGYVRAASEPGRGSVFTCYFPL